MIKSNRLFVSGLMVAGISVVAACSAVEDAQGALCCKDFKVGAELTADATFGMEGEAAANFRGFAQAAGDLSATATAMLDDVTNACRAIAVDGGATAEEQAAEDAKTGEAKVKGFCDLAIAKINLVFAGSATASASASLEIAVTPVKCTASLSASASCTGKCDVSGKCDASAKAPVCKGGKVEVKCEGSCEASAEAPSIACEGSCSGECSGSCEAEGGVAVDCQGKCDGTCEAGGSAGGNGAQADGSCKGTCKGTCTASATAPKVKCSGSCKGECKGSCTAKPGSASVKCNGSCSGKAEPISCEGGKLEASCEVDANCKANCDASVKAKAECTPPSVAVFFKGYANLDAAGKANVDVMIDSLTVNLPKIFVAAKARGQAFVDLTAQFSGSAAAAFDGKIEGQAVACLVPIGAAVTAAVTNGTAAFQASLSVAGSVGGGS